MDTSLDARARLIFDDVLDLPAAERSAAIARACARDALLMARVQALLLAAETDDGFLRDPTMATGSAIGANPAASADEAPGTSIGPYRILERIGEGGFGSVFMAEQLEPVRRRVALKIVKLGMDTRAVVARFEQERQALALMDHPNIAKVLDAGVTRSGRPYFVMELVRGEPINAYCDHARLSIAERIGLFTQVCRAVQHAHTKGIIHRDIKPSNVLVSTVDGRPLAKVIDFGIAKATERRLTEKTFFTEFHQFIGTPEYMSPEQAAGSLDIDTRTDVYALGVLLYELLTGTTPFDSRELRSAAYAEMQRIIREVDPPTPSARLIRSRETLAGIAALRRTPPGKLGSALRGELDWIVMRTLDKDRARRYDAAGDLAADVERFLEGKPVEAAPASAAYRLRKALRRNRLTVATGAVVAAALLVGTGVALWQARVAATERDAARESAIAADVARAESELRRRETEQVAEFEAARLQAIDPSAMGTRMLTDVVADVRRGLVRRGVEPGEIARREALLTELLADANPVDLALLTLDQNIFEGSLRAVDAQFKDQPVLAARLLKILGGIMLDLGLLERASEPLERSVSLRRKQLGDAHLDTLTSLDDLGNLRFSQSLFDDAEKLFREVKKGRELVLGPDHEETLSAANNLAIAMLMQGKLADAEVALLELLPKLRGTLGPDASMTLYVTNNVGGLLMELDRPNDAEPYFVAAMEGYRRTSGPDDPQAILSMSNLGLALEKQGKLGEAEPLYREAMERSRRLFGEEHWNTLLYKSNLGFLLCSLGRMDEAKLLTMEALATRRRLRGDTNGETLQSVHNAAVLSQAMGDNAAAEQLFREALTGRIALNGPAHWTVTQTRDALAGLFVRTGRFAEGEPLLLAAQRDVEASGASTEKQQVQRCQALVDFYVAWETADPDRGHSASAELWRSRLRREPR